MGEYEFERQGDEVEGSAASRLELDGEARDPHKARDPAAKPNLRVTDGLVSASKGVALDFTQKSRSKMEIFLLLGTLLRKAAKAPKRLREKGHDFPKTRARRGGRGQAWEQLHHLGRGCA